MLSAWTETLRSKGSDEVGTTAKRVVSGSFSLRSSMASTYFACADVPPIMAKIVVSTDVMAALARWAFTRIYFLNVIQAHHGKGKRCIDFRRGADRQNIHLSCGILHDYRLCSFQAFLEK